MQASISRESIHFISFHIILMTAFNLSWRRIICSWPVDCLGMKRRMRLRTAHSNINAVVVTAVVWRHTLRSERSTQTWHSYYDTCLLMTKWHRFIVFYVITYMLCKLLITLCSYITWQQYYAQMRYGRCDVTSQGSNLFWTRDCTCNISARSRQRHRLRQRPWSTDNDALWWNVTKWVRNFITRCPLP